MNWMEYTILTTTEGSELISQVLEDAGSTGMLPMSPPPQMSTFLMVFILLIILSFLRKNSIKHIYLEQRACQLSQKKQKWRKPLKFKTSAKYIFAGTLSQFRDMSQIRDIFVSQFCDILKTLSLFPYLFYSASCISRFCELPAA